MVALLIGLALGASAAGTNDPPAPTNAPLWRDPSQPMEVRVRDLTGKMTLQEKAQQICNQAPAISRLGLPAYNYWSECLHGVGRNGIATVFPQAIGLAATWDTALLHAEADVIATEARAKNRAYTEAHKGDSAIYTGLSFWSPNINIFRDPRWGRGQETYGEDPWLTSRMAVAFITGLQGDDPRYIKAMACAKHFAVHSGPEADRHRFDAEPPERDFYETYLPQFEAAVREGHVGAVMGAYNRIYGTPACANPLLLSDLLRGQWGFQGHVVSDCGAIYDFYMFHGYAANAKEASAMAVKSGCDLCCGTEYHSLTSAVRDGLATEKDLDTALGHLLAARFRLGLFDPAAGVPYAQIAVTENDTPAHEALALNAARESIVLLKNDGVLPLKRAGLRRIAVIGENAASVPVLLGNYNGTPSRPVTILEGIKSAAGPDVEVVSETGCPLAVRRGETNQEAADLALARAVAAAKSADVVIYAGGLNPALEGEEMPVPYDGFNRGDRTRIELPGQQTDLLKALCAAGKPVVFVNCSGSAVAMPWVAEHVPAIVQAWYPGEAGGRAVAEVLFGDYNPAGRLPVTFYRSSEDLPAFTNYDMAGRTYRYFKGTPLFAFGHGLSYTTFEYKSTRLDRARVRTNDTVTVSLEVTNTGAGDGQDVVQIYYRHVNSAVAQPAQALCGFQRVRVPKKQTLRVEIQVPIREFRYWDTVKKAYTVERGNYEVLVGASSDDIRARLPLRVVE